MRPGRASPNGSTTPRCEPTNTARSNARRRRIATAPAKAIRRAVRAHTSEGKAIEIGDGSRRVRQIPGLGGYKTARVELTALVAGDPINGAHEDLVHPGLEPI